MGWISEIFVHKAVAALADDEGADVLCHQLLRAIDVDPDAGINPKRMIPDTAFFDLLESLVRDTTNGRSVPVRLGSAMRCDDYGAFGLAFKTAANLLGSYQRVERFGKVVTSIANFRVVMLDASALMQVIPGNDDRLGLKMTNELAVAAATSISREVSKGQFRAKAVYFSHPAPDNNDEQAAHFQCPIHYEAQFDALEVASTVLEQPNQLSDPSISAFFDLHLDRELLTIDDPTNLTLRVMKEISGSLSEGVPPLSLVAAQLGMSDRTLQRRLAQSGIAYQDLVANARRNLAENLLHNTDFALAEISFLTGFADQSSFSRAFKRWHGQTPANFRRTRDS